MPIPGSKLITVIRKGTRALQSLPASPDAFVWLRLYQAQIRGLVARRPGSAVVVDAAAAVAGAGVMIAARAMSSPGLMRHWDRTGPLHDLRHSAAYRMARDPGMPLTDVILSFRVR